MSPLGCSLISGSTMLPCALPVVWASAYIPGDPLSMCLLLCRWCPGARTRVCLSACQGLCALAMVVTAARPAVRTHTCSEFLRLCRGDVTRDPTQEQADLQKQGTVPFLVLHYPFIEKCYLFCVTCYTLKELVFLNISLIPKWSCTT